MLFEKEKRKTVEDKYKMPIWLMRQAGRYHHHYQKMRSSFDFETLCLVSAECMARSLVVFE